MTISGIEIKARRILQDTHTPYRWETDQIRDAVQEGVGELNRIRPETRYTEAGLVDRITLPEEDSEPIALNDRYETAIVYYVVYKCYQIDDTDTVNAQLAESYLGKFNTKAQI